MASPLSADALLAALKAEGCAVVEVPGWRTRNRNSKGPWNDMRGSLVHHTVTSGTASTVAILRDGYAALPGPLCHGGIMKDGRIHLIGYGRANHAGGGDPIVLAHVTAEDYGDRPPVPTKGNKDGTDGNRNFYGWECENLGDGKDPWPAEQMDAIVRSQAAVIRAHRAKGDGWGLEAKSVLGHLEWSDDKPDPRGFTMHSLRLRIAERLTHPASWNEGDDVALTDGEVDRIANAVLAKFLAADKFDAPMDAADYDPDPASSGHFWSGRTVFRDLVTRVRNLDANVREILAKLNTPA
jgi:hypothetical protein